MEREGERLWLGTKKGLYLQEGTDIKCMLPNVEIFKLFLSSRGELWIASRMEGLYKRGRDGAIRKEVHSPQRVVSEQIRDFVEDSRQNVWFGTFDGLQMYNPYTDTYRVYRPNTYPGCITHQSVFSLYYDRQGTIWIGSYYGGINYFNQKKDIFRFYPSDASSPVCLDFPIVGQIIEDRQHDLWICTDGGGINRLHRDTQTFTYYTMDDKGGSILHNNVKSIAYDRQRDCIYVGIYTGGLSVYDKTRNIFRNYLTRYQQTGEGPNNIIFNILFVNDCLYIAAQNGFWRLHPDTERFELLNQGHLFQVFEVDSHGMVWLADSKRLYRMNINQPKALERIPLQTHDVKITRIMEAKDGTIYVATLGMGVFAYHRYTDQWTHFTAEKHQLLSNFCYNIAETPMNHILITNDGGFSIYSPFNQSTYSVALGMNKGCISAVAEGNGLYVSADDLIYIGGVDGMISFNEKDLYQSEDDNTGLYFSALYVNNVKVKPHDAHQVLDEALPFIRHVKLKANQNNLAVDFFSSDYMKHPRNIRYQYRLEGFDSQWFFAERPTIVYTNLRPGNYALKVREVDNLSYESSPREITLSITITLPWYMTGWAFLFYAVAFVLIALIIWHIRQSRRQLVLSLKKEKDEKERIEEINRTKLRFFTNISHEFRTPLTLIIGQLEILLYRERFSPTVRNRLQRIHKSATNLLFLITELLDFRKQDQGFLKLKVEYLDFAAFVKDIYTQFEEMAHKKQIDYSFDCHEELKVWFDPLQMQKVVFNILSNAFKYTSPGKSIQVSLKRIRNEVELAVADTGCGIPPEAQSKIFERFYQVDETSKESVTGSGIGLALTKGIVDAHHGTISVQSAPDRGSTFYIHLQTGNKHFTKEELEHEQITLPNDQWTKLWRAPIDTHNEEAEPGNRDSGTEAEEKPVILIVEDDDEMAEMLQTLFAPTYKVYRASNGKQGFEMACELHPDLVLSDVMMPVMSGKELCYKIKNCLELAYTPVVLLTAQVSEEYTLEGYLFGADDYVTKPFNARLLLVRCNNLLKNKRRLLETINQRPVVSLSLDKEQTTSDTDTEIVNKAVQIIRQHMENPDFDMKQLAEELHMGRTKMFASLKEATGLTPNELVLKIKLEEGLRLLKECPTYTISEISYRIGFSSPRYFSRCFKDFYGVSPLNYRKKDGDNEPL